jgi:hypothetical protein
MNREELNWLLQTIKDDVIAKRFVLAQYEHGRISLKVMADVGRERGWINPPRINSLPLVPVIRATAERQKLPIAAA